MKTWVRRTARVGILSAGFLLAGASMAHASNAVSAGNDGIGNGTQVVAPVQVPANVAGNGVGVAGVGLGVNGSSTSVADRAESTNLVSADNKGIVNGTQANVPVQVPANVAGNGVGVAGVGIGVNGSSTAVAHRAESAQESTDMVSAGNMGIGNGTQVNVPIQVPLNVCGNGVGVLGAGIGVSGDCTSVAAAQESAYAPESTNMGSVGNAGILNGTQVNAPIQVPVNVCGNGVGVLGLGAGVSGDCTSVAHRTESAQESTNMVSAANKGILNGTQVNMPIQVPVNVCGNGVGVLGAGIGISGNCGAAALSGEGGHQGGGYHSMATSTEGAEAAKPAKTASTLPAIASSHGTDMVSAGNSGIANGTQVHAPIQVPVNVAGNGVGVLGVGVGVNGSSTAVAAQH
ncbi:chaplin family protein [Actinocatenispora sera]|uniref:chaplin family protein n=1 Tax=Actinocatenispora sera TaxID=390989 RepID=UPI0033D9290D